MANWYSINISSPSVEIFNGYFSVDIITDTVKSFYETINGSTDFNNNIFANNNAAGANNKFINNHFSQAGTNITSMHFYINQPGVSFYKLFYNTTYNANLVVLYREDATAILGYQADFTITPISSPSCFNEGTKILCLNKNLEEEYISIEHLRKGDLVKSYKHGYRKIDLIGKNPMINNPQKCNECMYKMEKTDENELIDDLIITGGHAILVNDLGSYKEENDLIFGETRMIDDKYLLFSKISTDF